MKGSRNLENVRVLTYLPSEAQPLISVFETIAIQEGWHPGDQLHAFAEHSIYFAVEVEGSMVGGLQVELDDGSGRWSYQSVWPEVQPTKENSSAYISMLALMPEVRGQHLLFWLPCIEAWRYFRARSIDEAMLAATPSTLCAYRRFGWPLKVVGELREHWSEECYLCSMSIREAEAEIERRAVNSSMYQEIVSIGRKGQR